MKVVKLPREIWLLIFEYKRMNFERRVRAYVDAIFFRLCFVPPPPESSLEDLTQYKLEQHGAVLELTFNGWNVELI
tara:strand:+ start:8486 stop:8713 length:228 start_codon:yes stop_codon:yes gene_type:complete